MIKRYQIVSERDNRVVGGPFKKTVAQSELKRLEGEAAQHAPSSLNLPPEEDAAQDEHAAAIRTMMLETGPAPAEAFRIEEVELEREYKVGDDV